MTSIISNISNALWSLPLTILVFAAGVFLSVRMKFFNIKYAKVVMSNTVGAIFSRGKKATEKTISPFQAVMAALASTIGTGNIIGVATAIAIGGAGAVFWMWVAAFFGMLVNYTEILLGMYYRKKNEKGEWSGGAMYYLKEGLDNKLGSMLAGIFAFFCMLASLGIGNITQVNSIALSLSETFSLPSAGVSIALAAVAAVVIFGGIKRIGKVSEILVPIMAAAYIVATLIILVVNFKQIPSAFSKIFTEAFGFSAAAGGFSGIALKNALTTGIKRSFFSNEAGLGSTVMAHTASSEAEPVVQGMWGIVQVFIDTIILCTMTALAVLVTFNPEASENGTQLVLNAFNSAFGEGANICISVAIFCFAFSTLLTWGYYGEKSAEYIFGTKSIPVYRVIFIAVVVLAGFVKADLAWGFADACNILLAIPNIIGLVILSRTAAAVTRNYIKRRIGGDTNIQPMLSIYPETQWELEESLDD